MARHDTQELYQSLMASHLMFIPDGEWTLAHVYQIVQSSFSSLCDDKYLCSENCQSGYNSPEWHHVVRTALNEMRKRSEGILPGTKRGTWLFARGLSDDRNNKHHDELAATETQAMAEGYFSPATLADERQRRLREIVQRRGQSEFRGKLLQAYGERCAVTGCDAADALEAAHIIPYCGRESNHVSNGLLLRADIHTLFDLDLIGIDPKTMTIALGTILELTSYAHLQGKCVAIPSDISARLNTQAIIERWQRFSNAQ